MILRLRWMIILSLKWFIVIFKNMQRCLFYIVIPRWIQNNKVFKAVSVLNETHYGAVSGSKITRCLFSLSFFLRFLSSCRCVMSSCLLAMSSSCGGLWTGLWTDLRTGLWTLDSVCHYLRVVVFCCFLLPCLFPHCLFFWGIRFFDFS